MSLNKKIQITDHPEINLIYDKKKKSLFIKDLDGFISPIINSNSFGYLSKDDLDKIKMVHKDYKVQ